MKSLNPQFSRCAVPNTKLHNCRKLQKRHCCNLQNYRPSCSLLFLCTQVVPFYMKMSTHPFSEISFYASDTKISFTQVARYCLQDNEAVKWASLDEEKCAEFARVFSQSGPFKRGHFRFVASCVPLVVTGKRDTCSRHLLCTHRISNNVTHSFRPPFSAEDIIRNVRRRPLICDPDVIPCRSVTPLKGRDARAVREVICFCIGV